MQPDVEMATNYKDFNIRLDKFIKNWAIYYFQNQR